MKNPTKKLLALGGFLIFATTAHAAYQYDTTNTKSSDAWSTSNPDSYALQSGGSQFKSTGPTYTPDRHMTEDSAWKKSRNSKAEGSTIYYNENNSEGTR